MIESFNPKYNIMLSESPQVYGRVFGKHKSSETNEQYRL